MGRVILLVLVVVLIAGYTAMFITWNMTEIDVVGLAYGGTGQGVSMPIGFLALAGVIIGVLVMGFAAWSTWAAQAGKARGVSAQLGVAKQKLEERTQMVRDLREEVADLRKQLAEAEAASKAAIPQSKSNRGDESV
jgi:Zn-dependent protease with chaperone function